MYSSIVVENVAVVLVWKKSLEMISAKLSCRLKAIVYDSCQAVNCQAVMAQISIFDLAYYLLIRKQYFNLIGRFCYIYNICIFNNYGISEIQIA